MNCAKPSQNLKPVEMGVCACRFYSQKGYYLPRWPIKFSSPSGNLELKGLATEVLYYKDFQKRFGIEMEVVRLGNIRVL